MPPERFAAEGGDDYYLLVRVSRRRCRPVVRECGIPDLIAGSDGSGVSSAGGPTPRSSRINHSLTRSGHAR